MTQVGIPLSYQIITMIIVSTFIALIFGIGQALCLSFYIRKAWRWAMVLFSSFVIAGCIRVLFAYHTSDPWDGTWFYGDPWTSPVVGLILGAMQMRFFVPYTKRAWLWLFSNPIALFLTDSVVRMIDAQSVGIPQGSTSVFTTLWHMVSYIQWGIYSLVLAPVLWWMLRGMRFGLDGKALRYQEQIHGHKKPDEYVR